MAYNPQNHYWRVIGHAPSTDVYSSARAQYVDENDAQYLAWLDDGGLTTTIASQDDLYDVLIQQYEAGLPLAVRLRGVRPFDLINYLNAQGQLGNFITEIGGQQSVNYLRLLTADRVDVTTGQINTALGNVGINVNLITQAQKKQKWSND